MTDVFLDSAYAIALSVANDQHHELAVVLAERIEQEGSRIITSRAVVLEIGNALAKLRFRQAATELLDSLENDQDVEIIPITEQLYKKAFQLFKERTDKEWSVTDCISFVIMTERGLTEALTTDEHFQQAGFIALLV